MFETSVSAGAVAMLLLEGIKLLLRKFVLKNPTYDFPAGFYEVGIPVLSILLIPVMALVGFEGYVMPTDWTGWARNVAMVLIASLAALLGYAGALKPLKEYRAELKK